MSDENYKPRGDGVVQGDEGDLPNRGTSTGMVGMGAPYGASIDAHATNSLGGFHDACLSDPIDLERGRDARFAFGSRREAEGGNGMGDAAASDGIDEERNTAKYGGPK
jgi:hypothetical protein